MRLRTLSDPALLALLLGLFLRACWLIGQQKIADELQQELRSRPTTEWVP